MKWPDGLCRRQRPILARNPAEDRVDSASESGVRPCTRDPDEPEKPSVAGEERPPSANRSAIRQELLAVCRGSGMPVAGSGPAVQAWNALCPLTTIAGS